jgi:hypothetical protein
MHEPYMASTMHSFGSLSSACAIDRDGMHAIKVRTEIRMSSYIENINQLHHLACKGLVTLTLGSHVTDVPSQQPSTHTT